MEILRGVLSIFVITVVAGAIAYIGDRVGHQVGRRRLTLFGLRPKYTSTIVAVATGMLIALSVTLIAIVSSQQVQDAFFRLGKINQRINELQAQSDALEQKTRKGDLVLAKDTPLWPQFVVIQPTETREVQLKKLSQYFDATVTQINFVYAQNPFNLRPYEHKSTDAEIAEKLAAQLDDSSIQRNLKTNNPVLLLATTPDNLYRGDPLTFAFAAWQDRFVFAKGQLVRYIDFPGGTAPDVVQLMQSAGQVAAELGMPAPFVLRPTYDPSEANRVVATVARGKGVFRVGVRSAVETYVHSGGLSFRLTAEKVKART